MTELPETDELMGDPLFVAYRDIHDSLRGMFAKEVGVYMVDDLIQDTWVRVQESRGNWDPERPPHPWIRGIARNLLHEFIETEHVRGSIHEREFSRRLGQEGADGAPLRMLRAGGIVEDVDEELPCAPLDRREQVEILWSCLREVSNRRVPYRTALALFMGRIPYLRIARYIGRDLHHTHRVVDRGRVKLDDLVEKHQQDWDRRSDHARSSWSPEKMDAVRKCWDWISTLPPDCDLPVKLALFGMLDWDTIQALGVTLPAMIRRRAEGFDRALVRAGWSG
ncbi:MAG: sigma-70 family RNA polymerase sigma factor [Planctomycetes bacterium]|nr:sigma-70 family RNA polymerase sigma factor [Planctomycetota bacterium]